MSEPTANELLDEMSDAVELAWMLNHSSAVANEPERIDDLIDRLRIMLDLIAPAES